jgi:hypothetical protein
MTEGPWSSMLSCITLIIVHMLWSVFASSGDSGMLASELPASYASRYLVRIQSSWSCICPANGAPRGEGSLDTGTEVCTKSDTV